MLYMFVTKNDPNIGYILEQDKKKWRLLKLDLITDTISIIKNWIDDNITTIRLKYCSLNNDGDLFICSVADYSNKEYNQQHWSYIINLSLKSIINIDIQETSYCRTPYFHNNTLCMDNLYSRLCYKESDPSNLVLSNCGKNKMIARNKRYNEVLSKEWFDQKGRKISFKKNDIYINDNKIN
jgi:hypothetical protein